MYCIPCEPHTLPPVSYKSPAWKVHCTGRVKGRACWWLLAGAFRRLPSHVKEVPRALYTSRRGISQAWLLQLLLQAKLVRLHRS